MKTILRGTVASLALLTALAGCARPLATPQMSPAQLLAARDVASIDDDGPALRDAPTLTMLEPDAPTRAPNPGRTGNFGHLHASPVETLPALKALINGAEKSLWFETFNFGNDSMGKQIYPLLMAKAQAGVEVKVVMDYVGSRFIKGHGDMVKQMRKAGIDVKIYKPRWIVKDDKRRGINIQHRKIYMADGARALVGGVNLMAPFDTNTEDCLVEWRGPIVRDFASEFAYDYQASGGALLPLPASQPAQPDGDVDVRAVVTSPREGRYEGRDTIYAGIERAEHEINIANQFLWDDGLMDRLHAAAKRGVKIRVIVPGDEDHGPFRMIHSEELKKLTDEGAEARLFVGHGVDAHLHTKYFGVDEAWVAIGSTNGDTRALMDNQEIDTVITNRRLGLEFRDRMFARLWNGETKPFEYKPGNPLMRPFKNLLEILDYYL